MAATAGQGRRIAGLTHHFERQARGDTLEKWLHLTETTWEQVQRGSELARFAPEVVEQVVLEAKYRGYIDRQAAQVERFTS